MLFRSFFIKLFFLPLQPYPQILCFDSKERLVHESDITPDQGCVAFPKSVVSLSKS